MLVIALSEETKQGLSVSPKAPVKSGILRQDMALLLVTDQAES